MIMPASITQPKARWSLNTNARVPSVTVLCPATSHSEQSPVVATPGALGSCTSMTVGLYARKKQIPLESVTVSLNHSRIHAKDCEDCETREGMLDRIDIDIQLAGPLSEEQRTQLIEIAGKCPVHRTLTSEIDIRTKEKRV